MKLLSNNIVPIVPDELLYIHNNLVTMVIFNASINRHKLHHIPKVFFLCSTPQGMERTPRRGNRSCVHNWGLNKTARPYHPYTVDVQWIVYHVLCYHLAYCHILSDI